MLSRVADSLFWMSRYLERAEHTARLMDVNFTQSLDQTPEARDRRWERVLASLNATVRGADLYGIVEGLAFEPGNTSSIAACIAQARENARQVREQISTEMYEQINRLYFQVRNTNRSAFWDDEPHSFFKLVREGAHLFQGITDSTMSYDERWHFIQVGRFLERANNTSALLSTQFTVLRENEVAQPVMEYHYLDFVGLLKSCTAFEAYCKAYTADIQPERVAEFLLLNPDFPRSVCFAAEVIQNSLSAIGRSTGQRHAGRAQRLAGRLRAALDYGQVDEIMADDLHSYLASIQRQCGQIHDSVYQTYITYPADIALAS